LQPGPAALTLSNVNIKTPVDGATRNFGLILEFNALFANILAAAARASIRQRRFINLIELIFGDTLTVGVLAMLITLLATRLLGVRFLR